MAEINYYEVKLEDGILQEKFFKENRKDLKAQLDSVKSLFKVIKGLVSVEQLFPFITERIPRHYFYLKIKSDLDPWTVAEEIESLHFVDFCIPDLATKTYIDPADLGVTTDGGKHDEEFLSQWENAQWVVKVREANAQLQDAHRWWNWAAVNFPVDINERRKIGGWDSIEENISKLSLVQLDTGYTDHSKVKGAFDLDRDVDFVDEDDDARDEMDKSFLRQPEHGSRTASIIAGSRMKPPYALEGNSGILTTEDTISLKLIPYRISRSVVLIGREKDAAAAAYVAVERKADVMFMCMGSYPKPVLAEAVRYAYECGTIWVCAAGNEVKLVVAPALFPGTIAVAAINPENKPWPKSSRGKTVDISAPGEDIYVPRTDGKVQSMSFGSGTSYAAPHVASAAILWKAKHLDILKEKYLQPWQIVEAFRYCLINSANTEHWENYNTRYGAGVLDITKLLEFPLPEAYVLEHAYNSKSRNPESVWNLRTIEEVHNAWQQQDNELKEPELRSDEASDSEVLLKEYFESYE